MSKHSPLPWLWMIPDGMDEDTFLDLHAPVDFATWKCTGYSGNPILYDNNMEPVIDAGGGEYVPYNNPANALFIEEACNNYERVCLELESWTRLGQDIMHAGRPMSIKRFIEQELEECRRAKTSLNRGGLLDPRSLDYSTFWYLTGKAVTLEAILCQLIEEEEKKTH